MARKAKGVDGKRAATRPGGIDKKKQRSPLETGNYSLRAQVCTLTFRSAVIFWMAIFGLASSAGAADTEPLEDLPTWDKTYNLRIGAGYRDNLLLGHMATEKSVLLNGQFEATFLRLPVDGTQALFLFSADGTSYPDGKLADHEANLLTVAQVKRLFGSDWEAGITLQHLYQNQIIDATTSLDEYATLGGARTISIRGHSLRAVPSLKRSFAGNTWMELELVSERDILVQPLDDFWAFGPKLTLGYEYGNRSRVALSYGFLERLNDRANKLTTTGAVISGSHLHYADQEAALEWRHNWDAQRHWRTTARASYLRREDNGSGFFDYDRYQAAGQIRFVQKQWEFKAQVRASYYEYPVQTVSLTDLRYRNKLNAQFTLRGEYAIVKGVRFFTEFEHELLSSNREVDEFHVNTVITGVDWEF